MSITRISVKSYSRLDRTTRIAKTKSFNIDGIKDRGKKPALELRARQDLSYKMGRDEERGGRGRGGQSIRGGRGRGRFQGDKNKTPSSKQLT